MNPIPWLCTLFSSRLAQIRFADPRRLVDGEQVGNGGGQCESVVPQRPYPSRLRSFFFGPFVGENPIAFPGPSRRDGIALVEVMNENFDHLIGSDDVTFANNVGLAISLRLEVSSTSVCLGRKHC